MLIFLIVFWIYATQQMVFSIDMLHILYSLGWIQPVNFIFEEDNKFKRLLDRLSDDHISDENIDEEDIDEGYNTQESDDDISEQTDDDMSILNFED